MRFTVQCLWAAASAAAIAASPLAHAAGNGHSAGGHSSGGHWGGGSHGVAVQGGGGHWNGGHFNGGHWNGGHNYNGWGGGYRGGWHSNIGFYFGVPLFWGPWWDPFYYPSGYYYPGERVVYREVIREPEWGDTARELLPPGDVGSEGAVQAPPSNPMSTNYCPSAQAYFPQVRSCPEGWQLTPPTR